MFRLKETNGLEALFAASKASINSQSDALVCFVHAFLTSHRFVCTGLNDRDVPKTELLPDGWSRSQDVYVLRYFNEEEADSFTLKILLVDGIMTIQLLRQSDEAVATTNVKLVKFTGEDVSEFSNAYKDLPDLEVQLREDLLLDLLGGAVPPLGRHAPRPPPKDAFTRDTDPVWIGHMGGPASSGHLEPDDPFAVGRGDLDPLHAGVGGGMIMDPMRHGPVRDPNAGLPPGSRLPPGAVPPGARFDPFGPPGTGPGGPGRPGGLGRGGPSRFGPNPDHMRPPDYDDMFM